MGETQAASGARAHLQIDTPALQLASTLRGLLQDGDVRGGEHRVDAVQLAPVLDLTVPGSLVRLLRLRPAQHRQREVLRPFDEARHLLLLDLGRTTPEGTRSHLSHGREWASHLGDSLRAHTWNR